MMKKILIIQGNPKAESFCGALAHAYESGAIAAGAEVRRLDLNKLAFNPNLEFGYGKEAELEEDLVRAQQWIEWADHLVFVYPTWWGTMPALLKGFIDRVFLPGFAFKYRKGSSLWDKLLKGKSARLLVTLDTPIWYYSLIGKKPGFHQMKKAILGFCGVAPVRITSFSPIRGSSDEQRKRWVNAARQLGMKLG